MKDGPPTLLNALLQAVGLLRSECAELTRISAYGNTKSHKDMIRAWKMIIFSTLLIQHGQGEVDERSSSSILRK